MSADDRPVETHDGPEERRESLWWLVVAPTAWAAHFLASYATFAVWCAKVAGREGALGGARWAVAAYTVLALGVIAFMARHGLRRHTFGTATVPHDFDSPGDRHRFLGLATVLLSGLSAVGVIYAALVLLFFETCR